MESRHAIAQPSSWVWTWVPESTARLAKAGRAMTRVIMLGAGADAQAEPGWRAEGGQRWWMSTRARAGRGNTARSGSEARVFE